MERKEQTSGGPTHRFAQPQFQQLEPKMDNRSAVRELDEHWPFCANQRREPLAVDAEIPVNEFGGELAADGLKTGLQEALEPWL